MPADGPPRLRAIAISWWLFVGLSLTGCSGGLPRDLQIFPSKEPRAIARLVPKDGSVTYGLVTFTAPRVAVLAAPDDRRDVHGR